MNRCGMVWLGIVACGLSAFGCAAQSDVDSEEPELASTDEALGTTATPGVADWNLIMSQPSGNRIETTDVATDPSGNVWVACNESNHDRGYFSFDACLAKYDKAGKLLFYKSFPAAQADQNERVAIASDGSAWFSTEVSPNQHTDFGCGLASGAADKSMYVVVHFDALGHCLAQTVHTDLSVSDLAATPDGVVIYGYTYGGQADFGGGVHVSSPDHSALFVASLRRDMTAKWARIFGDPASPNGERPFETTGQIGVDAAGNIYFDGSFYGKLTFASTYDSQHHYRGFLAKYSSSGSVVWSHPYGDRARDTFMQSLSVSPDGHVAVSGRFAGTIDFGGGKTLYNGSSTEDVFVARLDKDANDIWNKRLWGTADMRNWGVAMDALGNVDLATSFARGDIHAGNSAYTGVSTMRTLVTKISPQGGTTIWSKVYADPGGDTYPIAIATAPSNRILIGGHLTSGVDFGKGTLSPEGEANGFLVQLFQ